MRNNTQLKQQAQMIKAAFEEGYKANKDWIPPQYYNPAEAWYLSTAKQMHDQLLMEAKSGLTTKTFADIWAEL